MIRAPLPLPPAAQRAYACFSRARRAFIQPLPPRFATRYVMPPLLPPLALPRHAFPPRLRRRYDALYGAASERCWCRMSCRQTPPALRHCCRHAAEAVSRGFSAAEPPRMRCRHAAAAARAMERRLRCRRVLRAAHTLPRHEPAMPAVSFLRVAAPFRRHADTPYGMRAAMPPRAADARAAAPRQRFLRDMPPFGRRRRMIRAAVIFSRCESSSLTVLPDWFLLRYSAASYRCRLLPRAAYAPECAAFLSRCCRLRCHAQRARRRRSVCWLTACRLCLPPLHERRRRDAALRRWRCYFRERRYAAYEAHARKERRARALLLRPRAAALYAKRRERRRAMPPPRRQNEAPLFFATRWPQVRERGASAAAPAPRASARRHAQQQRRP